MVTIIIIVVDELAYRMWKTSNPGVMFSRAKGQIAPPILPPNWEET